MIITVIVFVNAIVISHPASIAQHQIKVGRAKQHRPSPSGQASVIVVIMLLIAVIVYTVGPRLCHRQNHLYVIIAHVFVIVVSVVAIRSRQSSLKRI